MLTICTNHRSGKPVHKHKTAKFMSVSSPSGLIPFETVKEKKEILLKPSIFGEIRI